MKLCTKYKLTHFTHQNIFTTKLVTLFTYILPSYYQILKKKVFICLQGHQHHIRDGAAVDTDHTCEEW